MRIHPRYLALLALIAAIGLSSAGHGKSGLAPGFKLRQVTVKGKPYYATYRVCSRQRSKTLMNRQDKLRWRPSNNVWQYGSGFYVFSSVKDARKFISSSRDGMSHLLLKDPRTPVKARETIMEVLIPKAQFDKASKAEIRRSLDWATDAKHPGYSKREQLRKNNQILYGRWQEDPAHPFAAYKKMVGTPQLAVVNYGPDSLLNNVVVRMVSQGPEAIANMKPTPRPKWTRGPRYKINRSLPRNQRIQAMVTHNRSKHTGLHTLLEGKVDRHQGKKALSYLMKNFSSARAYMPRESGTWEGFSIQGHTLRAYNVLGNQIKHTDLGRMARAYPKINVKRTLQLALLLHDVGKPVAIDKARSLIDQTLAAGKSLEALDRGQLKHHSRYSNSIMSRIMWRLGSNAAEIRLARSLVACDALGQLEQGKTNMTGARDQIKQHASRNGLQAGDYFKLQSLFFTADAGAYRYLRRAVFERKDSGKLVPTSIGHQMLEMQLGNKN